jgi:hypothetical protein
MANDNPYEPPQLPPKNEIPPVYSAPPRRASTGALVMMVIMCVPAGVIAMCGLCLAGNMRAGAEKERVELVSVAIAAALIVGPSGLVFLLVAGLNRLRRVWR